MTVKLPIKSRIKNKGGVGESIKERIPAIVYGRRQEPIMVSVDRKEFEKTFKTAGESTVIALEGLSSPIEVLVKDVTFAPIKGGIVHIDFYAIEAGKEMTTHIPLHFTGEAPATKLGAVINKVLHELNITCKPADLPPHLDVDLGKLVEVDSKLTVADLVCPKGVKIAEAEDAIVAIAALVVEVAEEAPVVDIADIPVAQKGKTEEVAEDKQ
jgi:large subunit ribosomal protein L25